MRELAGSFFFRLGLFGASVKGKKDVHDVRTKLNEACTRSHHRLIVAPLKMEGVISLVDPISAFSGYVAIGYCELIESLRDSKHLSGTPCPECIEVSDLLFSILIQHFRFYIKQMSRHLFAGTGFSK